VKDSFKSEFVNLTLKWPVCTYFDELSNSWSTKGLELITYDAEQGIITCKTKHLSQFTVGYATFLPTEDNNTDNSTNTTDPSAKGHSYF